MRNTIKKSKARVIVAGDQAEFFLYEKPFYYDFIGKGGQPRLVSDEEQKKKNLASSWSRARGMIKRLVLANFNKWEKEDDKLYLARLITFTFAENVQDLDYTHKEMMLFLKRMNYELFKTKKSTLKYLGVTEFQERGAVHYHIVFFNLPWINRIYDVFSKVWGHGFILVSPIGKAEGAARYVTKYITKASSDERLIHRKKYLRSRNLKKFKVYKNQPNVAQMRQMASKTEFVYRKEFDHEKLGKTLYEIFKVDTAFHKACDSLEGMANS
jgi:hypothetical protein